MIPEKGVLLKGDGNFTRLAGCVDDLRTGDLFVSGLYASARSYAVAAGASRGAHLVIFPDRDSAAGCVSDLYALCGEDDVFFFPSADVRSSAKSVKEATVQVQRTAALGAVSAFRSGSGDDRNMIIVTYVDAMSDKVVSESALHHNTYTVRRGESVSFDFLKEMLFSLGFERVDFVSRPGEFAVRGGIVDVFSYDDDKPYRIDFFGDEVESIKAFDVNTQRSSKSVESLNIFPNLGGCEGDMVDFIELFPDGGTVWMCDIEDVSGIGGTQRKIYMSQSARNFRYDTAIEFHTVPQPAFNKNFDLLADHFRTQMSQGYEIYVMSESISQIERLKSIFTTHDLKVDFQTYTIQNGFVDRDAGVCLYTDHQIFERYRYVKLRRTIERSERMTVEELNSLHDGDYVVHMDHGVGRFGGLVKNVINGRQQEAIKLIYKDGDILFVSLHSLHKISKYRSADSVPPKIYKLGTGTWDTLKKKTKSKVKDIAADLVKLYAERRVAEGYAFSPDSYLMHELESNFMYEDTPDQHKAVEAVKKDMENGYPMDRLICGDVGFGKTEVAIRAAFKAVCDSKQVAVLVPTTILALQHYNTFLERLRGFPCTVEYVSRLRTTAELKDIAVRLKEGKIDIVIGTHRLLNKEIGFRDLGLLVIDEEQKFGVAAKERLRQLKLSVDTLTLSATPIPRTLQFSLLGARDLSIINTPPPNRQPISTEIIDFSEETLSEVIKDELGRGGQVFFVHNRVDDIEAVEEVIRRTVPGVRTCVGHGQMEPRVLEKIILDFMSGDYDVLVCTTIIENGLDIPNANTIIIDQAQNYGLSDLHQLRGRVGRSNRKAFCYLIVPPAQCLTDDARRRLNAIEAFSDLGSGFNIAMQDLDIRGMGNMLGAEQSGFIADMGFETYQRILSEAFEEIKAQSGTDIPSYNDTDGSYVRECMIDTDMELLIPDSYINIIPEKIRLYKELDSLSDEEGIERFTASLEDRFGPVPEQVKQLIYVVRLRIKARSLGFEKVVLKNEKMLMYFVSDQSSPYYSSPEFAGLMDTITRKGGSRYAVRQQNGKCYVVVQSVRTIVGAYNLISKL